jgi:outer membrane protein OmpA-like peptidoglycan-associated protein
VKKTVLFFSVLLILLTVLPLVSCSSVSQSTVQPPPVTAPPEPEPIPEPEPVPDTTGPELQVRFSSQYFSPDNDGTDDELTAYLSATDESGIGHWSFEIREPEAPNLLFSKWEGDGDPPAQFTWDGYSTDDHELVQSATEYLYTFTVSDTLGNVSTKKGVIQVDVLVIREGNQYRVQVPSIVFAPNSGGFEGLAADVIASNDWILKRIALVLNKFGTYQVKIEGHANITVGPTASAAARTRELRELQALSELRARTVVEYLANLGVDRRRMSYVGIGGSRPIVKFEDRDNWWKNRRVEFLLVR